MRDIIQLRLISVASEMVLKNLMILIGRYGSRRDIADRTPKILEFKGSSFLY